MAEDPEEELNRLLAGLAPAERTYLVELDAFYQTNATSRNLVPPNDPYGAVDSLIAKGVLERQEHFVPPVGLRPRGFALLGRLLEVRRAMADPPAFGSAFSAPTALPTGGRVFYTDGHVLKIR